MNNLPGIICRYCDGDILASTVTPEGKDANDYHSSATCVEGSEPSYKMGGPA